MHFKTVNVFFLFFLAIDTDVNYNQDGQSTPRAVQPANILNQYEKDEDIIF